MKLTNTRVFLHEFKRAGSERSKAEVKFGFEIEI